MSSKRVSDRPLYIWHYDYYLSGNAPDAFSRFDADLVADEIVSTGANFVAVFALNQHGYAYYPSEIAPVHPTLGGLDYTGSMLEALHEREATVITYVNFMNIERREDHPEWWQRDAEGNQVYERGWGVPCPNSPIREYMTAIVREVAELYPTDGFFFDMYGFNAGGCWCDYCRAKFAEEHDLPFPLKQDWGSESWIKYIDFRYRSATEAMRYIRDGAKAVRPDLIWVTHAGPHSNWTRGTGTLGPVLDDMLQSEVGTYYGRGRWAGGYRAKLMQPYGRGQQLVTILADLHRDMSGSKPRGWFYIPWSATQVKRGVAEILAHGAWPDIYTEPYPDGRNNPYTVEGIKAAFTMAKQVEPYVMGSESVKSVALHFSRSSLDFFGKDEPVNYMRSYDGAYKALMQNHIHFDVVMDEQILNGEASEYDLLVLANSACTSEKLNHTLRQYVANGGSIIATYKTSLYDEHGRKRSDFGLADLFGANYRLDYPPAYIEVDGELADGLTSSPIIAHRLLRVEAHEESEALGKLVGPSPTDLSPFTYFSAPAVPTEWPALLCKGRVIYCTSDVGFSFMSAGYPDHVRLLTNCINFLIGDKLPARLQAPGTVDFSLRRQEGRYLAHLVNLTTDQIVEDAGCELDGYEAITLHQLELRVRLGERVRCAYRGRDGLEMLMRDEGDWQVIEIPELEIYEVIVLEL